MSVKYTDSDIEEMIQERKPLPPKYRPKIQLRSKPGHKESELNVEGVQGNQYRLILRQSIFNTLDFSIILAVIPAKSNQLFRLRRYNGKSHKHTNIIERNTFYYFHIHLATERYQNIGTREDAFAEPTDRFSDVHTALQCLIQDCGFVLPDETQTSLFRGLQL